MSDLVKSKPTFSLSTKAFPPRVRRVKEDGVLKTDARNDKATYCDFTTCDVPLFMSNINPVVSTRWLTTIEGEAWVESCSWKEFKEMFGVEYAPVVDIYKIRDEFQSPIQTNETLNEPWKKLNDMVLYCLKYLDFSKIASSLTKLTRKNASFEWGEEQEEAFCTLQKKLCETLILVLPEGTEDMVVYSDTSYFGLGCLLMQIGHPCVEKKLGRENWQYRMATTEKTKIICERLKVAEDRWKSYTDHRRRLIEFKVGDFVMMKVFQWKGVLRFRNKGKLSPRFIGPFKFFKRVGEVAYVLELPKEMKGIHNTFHV
nr:hypothetical protein [Tanacetum cinerariifolium]